MSLLRVVGTLAAHATRLIECVNSSCAESPEMQRNVTKLQEVRQAQPLVELGAAVQRQNESCSF